MEQGEVNGQLWDWHPGQGWGKLPGTESSGPNGVVVSPDGKWLFYNIWGGKSVVRMSLGGGPARRSEIPMDFRPDNIHWAPDGQLLVGGATVAADATKVVKIDPLTLKITPLLDMQNTPEFWFGSGAIQVGQMLWISSPRANHIAIVPLPSR